MSEIYIYGGIREGLSAEVASQLEDNVTVRLNSYGGDVFEAIAIYNLLKQHGGVTVIIDGIAASAATLIMCGGSTIKMAENALIMIHEPAIEAWDWYTAGDLTKAQNALAAITEIIIATYEKRTGKSRAELEGIMKAETWLRAAEALSEKFIDEVIKVEEVGKMNSAVMEKYKASVIAAERKRIADLMLMKKGDLADTFIDAAISTGQEVAQVQGYIEKVRSAQPRDQLAALIKDNLESGSKGVEGDFGKGSGGELIAKYANEIMGAGKNVR